MLSTYSSIAVAKKILELSELKGNPLTPMQLIKLTYLAHGWMLGLLGRPLLSERVEAWKYGPVLPNLYSVIKKHRDKPVDIISLYANDVVDDESATAVINEVLRVYGELDGIALSTLTHQKNTPWEIVWSQLGQQANISNDIIESHFKRMLQVA